MALWYRLLQAKWQDSAFNGEGARLYGGRWNFPGLPAVYLAQSRSLAALEILVHAPREALGLDWRVISVEVEHASIEIPAVRQIPTDWRELPSSQGARHFGSAWLQQGKSFALQLPSAIVPEERILLLNPQHKDFRRIGIQPTQTFYFDPRLSVGSQAQAAS